MIGVLSALSGHLLVACFSASFGFLVCAMLSGAKIARLVRRTETAELQLAEQTKALQKLAGALRLLLSQIERAGNSPAKEQAIKRAASALVFG